MLLLIIGIFVLTGLIQTARNARLTPGQRWAGGGAYAAVGTVLGVAVENYFTEEWWWLLLLLIPHFLLPLITLWGGRRIDRYRIQQRKFFL